MDPTLTVSIPDYGSCENGTRTCHPVNIIILLLRYFFVWENVYSVIFPLKKVFQIRPRVPRLRAVSLLLENPREKRTHKKKNHTHTEYESRARYSRLATRGWQLRRSRARLELIGIFFSFSLADFRGNVLAI